MLFKQNPQPLRLIASMYRYIEVSIIQLELLKIIVGMVMF